VKRRQSNRQSTLDFGFNGAGLARQKIGEGIQKRRPKAESRKKPEIRIPKRWPVERCRS
jgi:hypothetical protein